MPPNRFGGVRFSDGERTWLDPARARRPGRKNLICKRTEAWTVNVGGPSRSGQPTRLRVTSETGNIARVRAAVERAALDMGFAEPDATAVALAIDEAVANVIRHGYEGREGQPIEVTIEPVSRGDRAGLEVTICDCGRQVELNTIVGRKLEDVRPGGLGTHIMKAVMDEVEYKHRQPEGMQLRLLKLLDSPAGAGCDTTSSAQEDSPDGRR